MVTPHSTTQHGSSGLSLVVKLLAQRVLQRPSANVQPVTMWVYLDILGCVPRKETLHD